MTVVARQPVEVIPVSVGDVVVFADEHGHHHDALVTYVHGGFGTWREHYEATGVNIDDLPENLKNDNEWLDSKMQTPLINLVYVSKDKAKDDQYGRQTERRTSVGHVNNNTAHGFFWKNK